MIAELKHEEAGWVKLNLLTYGIEITPSIANLSQKMNFAERKNFYNNPLWQGTELKVPQELQIHGLVVGLNAYGKSPWQLALTNTGKELVLKHRNTGLEIHPDLISDLNMFAKKPQTIRLANFYGGAALAFFSPRGCYFFTDNTQCSFCSLAGTANEERRFIGLLSKKDVRTTIASALEYDFNRIEQIMIVGGNMRDLNKGFQHHIDLALAAYEILTVNGVEDKISIHISTMPPRNLKLLEKLKAVKNIHVMFNLEVWEPAKFLKICPGKAQDYGRGNIIHALEILRDTIGTYKAHSLLVTGLESPETTIKGATALASMGISPIINIYHSDQHSVIGLKKRPLFNDLTSIARGLQSLYDRFPLKPYWKSCGRNAIDAEAESGLFHKPIPEFLS